MLSPNMMLFIQMVNILDEAYVRVSSLNRTLDNEGSL